jgi:hypothetical protein
MFVAQNQLIEHLLGHSAYTLTRYLNSYLLYQMTEVTDIHNVHMVTKV